MNSDEDPSFPFICEGPSGVLTIFGETSGVLPVMSTSAEVADLEDVFAKASMPIQTTQSDSQKNTVIAKSSTNVLSEFRDTVLAAPEKSKKAETSAVVSDSIALSEEIQEVLIESTIVAGNTGLVPVVETTKSITETTSTAVTGSVELAEEIMEAFANSKNVLDTENPVSNDPCTLQEELERLEQLAVERVREIEGELVNSTKQMTECNLNLDITKEPKSTEVSRNEQKEFESEVVVPDATDTSPKEVGESLCDDGIVTVDLTSPSEMISVVSEISSADGVKKKQINSSNLDLSESVVASTMAQEKEPELIDISTSETEKTLVLSKNNDTIPEQKGKIENTSMEVQEVKNDAVSKLVSKDNDSVSEVKAGIGIKSSEGVGDTIDILSDTEGETNLSEKKGKDCENDSKPSGESKITSSEEEKKEQVGEKVECSSSSNIQETQEIIVEKQFSSDKSGASKDDPMTLDNTNKCILETGDATATMLVAEDGKKIKDMQNYETEDDDLEVLEAFIVKTATNPELAVCTVQPSKDDSVSKYSLESALLDDLTKTDYSSSTNEVENRSDKVNEDSVIVQSSGGDSVHEKPKKITGGDSSDANSKVCGDAVGHHLGMQAITVSSERKLSEKKCTTETSGGEIVCDDNTAKTSNKKTEKKVVFVEVKRRSGRSLISGKKASIAETPALLRKERSSEQTVSEKFHSEKGVEEKSAKQDQSSIKKSMRNSKKMKVGEESVPSTSGIVSAQQVAERSGVSKIQKKHVEHNSDSLTSTSKTMLKNNENKGEARPTTSVKTVETSSKEKKKSKDVESNNDEISTSHGDLKSVSDKRNTEYDFALKSSKKDERRLKENGETPTNRNIKGGSNNSDATNSRSTRSAKKIVTAKSTQPTNQSEHIKEKNKENVEKLTRTSIGDGDVKKYTERIMSKETPSKNEKRLSQKRHRSLSEDARDAKKKNDGNLQVSSALKRSREQDVEGLPSSHKKAEEDFDRGSASPKVSSSSLKQKTTEEKNSHGSGTPVKRRKTEKESEGSVSDVQLSPNSLKRKRVETERKEISSEIEIPQSMLKRKKEEIGIEQRLHTTQISPTTLKRKRVEREFEQHVLNDGIEVAHGDSNGIGGTLHRIPNVYSDNLFVEFEEITFDLLRNKAKQLVLPTPLWGAQVSSEKDLVAFSRLRADLSSDKPMIDKALVFQGSLKPIALINNEPVDLPIPCVRTYEDVVILIRNFHSVSFCEGTGVKQRPQSKSCFRYLDVANPGGRCSQCLEERRRVLFGCARKLRERINVMKTAKSLQ